MPASAINDFHSHEQIFGIRFQKITLKFLGEECSPIMHLVTLLDSLFVNS